MTTRLFVPILLLVLLAAGGLYGEEFKISASLPQAVELSMYDKGVTLVSERRRIPFAQGPCVVIFEGLPAEMDDQSVVVEVQQLRQIDSLGYRFCYDMNTMEDLLRRYEGEPVVIRKDGTELSGTLVRFHDDSQRIGVKNSSGAVQIIPALESVDEVRFPDAESRACLRPVLRWNVVSKNESLQPSILRYSTEGLAWQIFYECLLEPDGTKGSLSGRLYVENETGADYRNARIELVSTELGDMDAAQWRRRDVRSGFSAEIGGLRFPYGSSRMTFERWKAGLSPLYVYDVAEPVSLNSHESKVVQLFTVQEMPFRLFYVYDGVRFDRFQRNPQRDWNYGTESHDVVESYMEFEYQPEADANGVLLPGRMDLYQRQEDDSVRLLGRDFLQSTVAGDTGFVRLGPAADVQGSRERIGYHEVVPLHEYEESFEIRLSNDSTKDIQVRVVEHLYRSADFEIVRADTEYEKTGEQRIEFRPVLKPGGRRSIRYTVKYRW